MSFVSRAAIALTLYLVFVTTVIAARPALMFDRDGRPKRWGARVSDTTSVFAPAFVFPLAALLAYVLASLLQLSLPRLNFARGPV